MAEEAIISRIDVCNQASREHKDGIIRLHDGNTFRREYRFNAFEIEIDELSIFIPVDVLPLMNEMLERRLAARAEKAKTTNA